MLMDKAVSASARLSHIANVQEQETLCSEACHYTWPMRASQQSAVVAPACLNAYEHKRCPDLHTITSSSTVGAKAYKEYQNNQPISLRTSELVFSISTGRPHWPSSVPYHCSYPTRLSSKANESRWMSTELGSVIQRGSSRRLAQVSTLAVNFINIFFAQQHHTCKPGNLQRLRRYCDTKLYTKTMSTHCIEPISGFPTSVLRELPADHTLEDSTSWPW